MKTLINNLVTIIKNAITASSISAKSVYKGFGKLEGVVPVEAYPYIAIDDGGEEVSDLTPPSTETQERTYRVLIEIGAFAMDEEKALDEVLDIYNEVKAEIEKKTNRQLSGHNWGKQVETFGAAGDNNLNFFRGRRILVEFFEIEDRPYNPF